MATEPILAVLDGPVAGARHGPLSVFRDYWASTKPEISLLIAFTTGAAFYIGSPAAFSLHSWLLLLHAVVGTVLVASGAGALNQLIERRSDSEMRRTSRRPIAAARIEPSHALIFGTLLSVAGSLYLSLAVRPAASVLGLLALGGYLLLYTPLKLRTHLCTLAGAFPGAMPALIGYVGATGKLDSQAWELYAILFFWQFPHFMAIAWIYREDYARAGYKVLPTGREKAWFMGWQSVLPALLLVCVTVVPLALRRANPVFVAGTFLLSLGFFYFAARLALLRTSRSARHLLLTSVIYLPSVFVLQVMARVF